MAVAPTTPTTATGADQLSALIQQLAQTPLNVGAAQSDANNVARNTAASRKFMQDMLPQISAAARDAGTSGSALQALLVQNGADNAAGNAALTQGQLANQADQINAQYMASQLSDLMQLHNTITQRDTSLSGQANQLNINAAHDATQIQSANIQAATQAAHDQSAAAVAAAHDAVQKAITGATNSNNLAVQALRNKGALQASGNDINQMAFRQALATGQNIATATNGQFNTGTIQGLAQQFQTPNGTNLNTGSNFNNLNQRINAAFGLNQGNALVNPYGNGGQVV